MSKLEPGRYKAKILYHTIHTNNAGNPELRLSVLPIAGADNQPLPPKYTATPITIFLTITPATMEMPQSEDETKRGDIPKPGWVLLTLQHLGFTSLDLATLDPTHDCAHIFTGREILILGSEDEYKGKKRTRWNILRTSSETKPVETNRLNALSERFRRVLTTNPNEMPDSHPDAPPF